MGFLRVLTRRQQVILACDAQWRAKDPDGFSAGEKPLDPDSPEYETGRLHILQCEVRRRRPPVDDLLLPLLARTLSRSSPAPHSLALWLCLLMFCLAQRIVLHTISFDLCVEHPYKFLIESVRFCSWKLCI